MSLPPATVAASESSSSVSSVRVVRAACPHDCPDTCAMLVTVEGERAIQLRGDPDHPTTRGFLCAKVNRYLERTYHPERLLYPQRRVGPKGRGQFERITWDEAISEICTRFRALSDEVGPQSILPYSYAGTMGQLNGSSMDRRFFHRLGASLLDRTICATAGVTAMKLTLGANAGMDPEHFAEARLILLWGTNTLTSNPHLWPFIKEARKAGAKVIAIDPWRSRTAEQCDQHVAIKPGTDAALALGLMHILFRDGLHDPDYLSRYCVGAEALRARVHAYPPERVASITGLSRDDIEALAHAYGTTRPSAIRVNYGLQRHRGGGSAVRAIACLPAVVGDWRHHAGGVVLSTSGHYGLNAEALERPELIPAGTRTINMSRLGEALTALNDPPVRALFVYNSNPAAVAPDLGVVKRGLLRDDLFTVVHEHFMTDTAMYADLLLPATTQLEHADLHKAYGHLYLLWNEPAIPPIGESIPNTELFRRLAAGMGFTEPCLRDRDDDIARQALESRAASMQGITLERLKREGWVRLSLPRPFAPYAEGGFPTPSGKCELYSQQLEAQGFDPLPTYIPMLESEEENPALFARYPLTLLSPPAHHFLNSTFGNVLQRYEKEPLLQVHPRDAAARGITDGMPVCIWNERGAFEARAELTDKVQPGVVLTLGVWWARLSKDGRTVNDTTSQALTDLGAGATFYDNLVEIKPLKGEERE